MMAGCLVNICQRQLKAALALLCLAVLVVLYIVLGGMMFQYLEKDEELKTKRHVKDLRAKRVNDLWDCVQRHKSVNGSGEWKHDLLSIIRKFEVETCKAVSEHGWDGRDSNLTENTKWTFSGGLLMATTVVTTIGYGNIVPRTDVGKVVMIVYAIFGIPLTLLCIARYGMLVSLVPRGFWKYLTRVCRIITRKPDEALDALPCTDVEVPIVLTLAILTGYILLGAMVFSTWEESWTLLDGFYFSFITLSTIGFGDMVPGQETLSGKDNSVQTALQVWTALYVIAGLIVVATCFDLAAQAIVALVWTIFHRVSRTHGKETPSSISESSESVESHDDDTEEEWSPNDSEEEQSPIPPRKPGTESESEEDVHTSESLTS